MNVAEKHCEMADTVLCLGTRWVKSFIPLACVAIYDSAFGALVLFFLFSSVISLVLTALPGILVVINSRISYCILIPHLSI